MQLCTVWIRSQRTRTSLPYYRISDLNKQEVTHLVESMELLDYLSAKAGCMYLSDLHRVNNFLAVHHALRELPPDTFSVKEWNDAVRYITGEQHDFFSSDEAEKYLAEYVMKKGTL